MPILVWDGFSSFNGPAPLQKYVSGIFAVQILEDFAGDFPGRFFWALFFHKNEEKKSATRSAKKKKNPAAQN